MKAVILKEPGDTKQLQYTEVNAPQILDGEVLIQVKAISINPVDFKTRIGQGAYGLIKDEFPIILGWDISGVITEVGDNVHQFTKGDEVFGMINFPGHGGGYAEFVVAPATQLALKPHNISFEQAAATTLAALTALQALTTHARLAKGQSVLIHGASGGVGHFAIQIARFLGAKVIGISSGENREFIINLGADKHIDYQTQAFEESISNVDLVFDTIGGEYTIRSLDVIKNGGTLISIPADLNEQALKKAEVKGVNAFRFVVNSNGKDMETLAELLEKGIIRPYISRVFSFDEIVTAHVHQESGRTRGKIVVSL